MPAYLQACACVNHDMPSLQVHTDMGTCTTGNKFSHTLSYLVQTSKINLHAKRMNSLTYVVHIASYSIRFLLQTVVNNHMTWT